MADADVVVISWPGMSVRIPKETFQFMLVSAHVELNRHLHELDKEPEAPSAKFWTESLLKEFEGR